MRDYAKLAPTFWTGKTGRALKRRGSDAVIVALYLVSSPHSNMLGLFYQPILYLAEETGLTIEGASKGLQACVECSFCSYDQDSKVVWVHEMAAWQIAPELSSGDKRCKGIQKDYDALPDNPFLGAFFDRYQAAFHLSRRREFEGDEEPGTQGAYQAPSKPLRSQEQEQEQEQEQDVPPSDDGGGAEPPAPPPPPAPPKAEQPDLLPGLPDCPHEAIIAAFHEALPMARHVRDWTPARAQVLRARWREDRKRQTLDWWRRFFAYCAASPFLTGRSSTPGRRPFELSLDWLVKSENFAKVREGAYHEANVAAAPAPAPAHGEPA